MLTFGAARIVSYEEILQLLIAKIQNLKIKVQKCIIVISILTF